jgi:hypothetical protein
MCSQRSPETPVTQSEYLKRYATLKDPLCARKEALKQALDIRKFEIELYWKRATYFWTFIAAAFAGFFALQKDNSNSRLAFVVACLGFLFSLCWYFVNRGSKAWQENWESHVDLLEDEIVGQLHKSVLNSSKISWWNIVGPYRFSPSKINQLLSLYVTAVWLVLLTGDFAYDWWLIGSDRWAKVVMSIMTALFAIVIAVFGQTGRSTDPISIKEFIRKVR